MTERIKIKINWLWMSRWQNELKERWMDYGWVDDRIN